MDHRAIKRPRSESGVAGDPNDDGKKPVKPTKTKKKQKKSKGSKPHSSSEDKTSSSREESMATVEGQTMAQVLSTFNRMEHSRFEAFKRSTFRGDAIATYVAHCLAKSHERAFARGEKTRQLMGGSGLGVGGENPRHDNSLLQRCPYVRDPEGSNNTNSGHDRTETDPVRRRPKRSLEDMVAPGQAEEITVVVSTLAKAYAQRLVTAARRVASAEGQEDAALSPRHVLLAHQARVTAGVDPGFFLQARPSSATNVTAGNSAATAAALGIVNRHELERNAALAAQEEYDKQEEEKAKLLLEQEKANQEEKVEEEQTEEGDKQKRDETEEGQKEKDGLERDRKRPEKKESVSMEDILMDEMDES